MLRDLTATAATNTKHEDPLEFILDDKYLGNNFDWEPTLPYNKMFKMSTVAITSEETSFSVSRKTLHSFIESIITFSITCWFPQQEAVTECCHSPLRSSDSQTLLSDHSLTSAADTKGSKLDSYRPITSSPGIPVAVPPFIFHRREASCSKVC